MGSIASRPVFAQGTTESDAASAEEAQSASEPIEIISTIQSLLNQAAVEYGIQNFTGELNWHRLLIWITLSI